MQAAEEAELMEDLNSLIPSDLLDEVTQMYPPETMTGASSQSMMRYYGIPQTQPEFDEFYAELLGLPSIPLPATSEIQDNLVQKEPTTPDKRCSEGLGQPVFQSTPKQERHSPVAPNAPKKPKVVKKQRTGIMNKYEKWPLGRLKTEFVNRFQPPSQKRLSDRSFMAVALHEYDMRHGQTNAVAKGKTSNQECLEPKGDILMRLFSDDEDGFCERCNLPRNWLHVCPSIHPPKPPSQSIST
jgi:hypothetical protein